MTLFKKLATKAGKAAMDKAFARGLLRCPNCGQKPTKAAVDMQSLQRCDSCGMDSLPINWPGRAMEVRLEGDETQVALRTYQHGRVIKEKSFARSSVSGILATHTGHVNGKPMKSIDLIVDGKAHRITRWNAADAADVRTAEVCQALGVWKPVVRN